MPQPDYLVSFSHAASKLEVSVQTIYKWKRLGRITVERNPVTGRYALRESELQRIQTYVRPRG
jgi:predicted site-specific integrase-resolvase